MVGSFVTRALALVLGYAYPAYDCYKTVELNRPEIEQLRFWCQYWILIALLTVVERAADSFVSWLPMYSEAKLLFIVYLWYPKTRGTTYVYDTFFKPYVSKHESEIDRNLLELKTRAGDLAATYFQKVSSYGQSRFYEVLQYVASQSQAPRARPQRPNPQAPSHARQAAGVRQPAVAAAPAGSPPSAPPEPAAPRTPTNSGPAPVTDPTLIPSAATGVAPAPAQPSSSVANPGAPEPGSADYEEPVLVEMDAATLESDDASTPAEDTAMEEAIRVTRGRLRRRLGSSVAPAK